MKIILTAALVFDLHEAGVDIGDLALKLDNVKLMLASSGREIVAELSGYEAEHVDPLSLERE